MDLKVTKKTIMYLDDVEFDRFVSEKYGGNFEFVPTHEANNDSQYSFNVPNCAKFFGNDAEQIRSGEYPMYCVHKVFQCLFEDGLIEEGEYTINVSW